MCISQFSRALIDANVRLSKFLDNFLPSRVRQDGSKTFIREFLPRAFQLDTTIYDLGGGSNPRISREDKEHLRLILIGLDIDADELASAPAGVYDHTIVADLCSFVGNAEADAVICQSTLEHVHDTRGAMYALATLAKPGGRIFIFSPCRNAVFARLNLILPENVKQHLLFALFPEKAQKHNGFKAYYDQCTPRQIEALARANNLVVEERRLFWTSSYFTAFTPLFIAWRLWQLLAYLTLRENAAETFAYILRKKPF